MIIPRRQDAIHKAVLYRVLAEILDDSVISQNVFFKGGSCAAMLGWLDRFSLDLDFDLKKDVSKALLRKRLFPAFRCAGVTVKQEDSKELFFILKYDVAGVARNTLKVVIIDKQLAVNTYAVLALPELDRLAKCQTRETMVANKLVALIERFEKYNTIAGRDVYDAWYFFSHGYSYRKEVIEERRGTSVTKYFKELVDFVHTHVTDRVIGEDLNYLLTPDKFNQVRKILKRELIMFIQDELARKQ